MAEYLRDGSPQPAVLRYGLAVASVAIAVFVTQLNSAKPVVSTAICALLLSTWYGGAGPGLLAWVLSVLATAYFFIPVLRDMQIDAEYLLSFLLFSVSALLAVGISIAQRNTSTSLRFTRDELRAKVTELSKVNLSLEGEIAERQRAEEAAQRSEAELRDVIDSIPVIAWTARPDGTNEFANRFWLEFTGVPRIEVSGTRWMETMHPSDLPAHLEKWRASLATGTPFESETRLRRGMDGAFRWFLHRAIPRRGENGTILKWYGISSEIDDRKRAEAAVQESEKRLRSLLEHAYDAIILLDMHGCILYASPSLERVLGYHPEELLGRKLLELLHLDYTESIAGKLSGFVRQEETSFEILEESLFRHKDRTWRWIQAVATNLLHEPSIQAIVVNLRDVTESKYAQDAVREAQAEIARVARITTLGELAASIAHEVNQPLGAIVTGAGAGIRWLDAKPPNFGEARQALLDIIKDGNHAAAVISRIRALARKLPTRNDRLCLGDVISDIIPLTREQMERGRIALRSDIPANLPTVLGDSVQLQQVILNLVINAIEAMTGSEQRDLLIKAERDGTQRVKVSVHDTGQGLDPETLQRIFDSFYTTKSGGIGMGLSICRSIIEIHGGQISARPNTPRGAIFEFELPAEEAGCAETGVDIDGTA